LPLQLLLQRSQEKLFRWILVLWLSLWLWRRLGRRELLGSQLRTDLLIPGLGVLLRRKLWAAPLNLNLGDNMALLLVCLILLLLGLLVLDELTVLVLQALKLRFQLRVAFPQGSYLFFHQIDLPL